MRGTIPLAIVAKWASTGSVTPTILTPPVGYLVANFDLSAGQRVEKDYYSDYGWSQQ